MLLRLLVDVVAALIFCAVVGAPCIVLGFGLAQVGIGVGTPWWQWATIPVAALAFVGLLIGAAAVVSRLIPRPRPGHYAFPGHPQACFWILHFTLQRVMYLPLWRHFMFSFSTTRWLLLNALGAKAAFEMNTAGDTLLLDPPMLELGEDTMVAGGCTLSGHLVEKEKLFLGKIRLARGVQVHGNVVIGPGVTIGEHTMVGPECRLAGDVEIGEYAHLGAACFVNTGVRIGDNVVVGNQVTIESNVVVGADAVIASGTRVPRGTKVSEGERYGKSNP